MSFSSDSSAENSAQQPAQVLNFVYVALQDQFPPSTILPFPQSTPQYDEHDSALGQTVISKQVSASLSQKIAAAIIQLVEHRVSSQKVVDSRFYPQIDNSLLYLVKTLNTYFP